LAKKQRIEQIAAEDNEHMATHVMCDNM
jgi:hypothetical protein